MSYYTKEWYDLMQKVGLAGQFKKIPDAEYSSQDIQFLYDKKLKKEIQEDRPVVRKLEILFIMELLRSLGRLEFL